MGCAGEDGASGQSASVQTAVLKARDAHCAKGGAKIEVLLGGKVQGAQTE